MKLHPDKFCSDKGGVNNNENIRTEKQVDDAGTNKITKVKEIKW